MKAELKKFNRVSKAENLTKEDAQELLEYDGGRYYYFGIKFVGDGLYRINKFNLIVQLKEDGIFIPDYTELNKVAQDFTKREIFFEIEKNGEIHHTIPGEIISCEGTPTKVNKLHYVIEDLQGPLEEILQGIGWNIKGE